MHRTARILAAALAAVLLGTGVAEAAGDAPLPLILKQRVVVDGDGVRLSDLFANVPAASDGRVADSPAPGDRMVFGARQLLHYANSFGLPWRPQDARVYAEVVRDSVPVPVDLIRDALVDAIAPKHPGGDFEVEIYNRDIPLFVATGSRPEIIVRNLAYDPRSSRFDASISLADSQTAPAIVNGRVVPMVEVPVLRGRAMPGDVIGKSDIQWIRVEARRAGTNTVTRLEDIVGQTPRRPISAGQTIRLSDVHPNFVIERGDLVTIVLKVGAMTLTARAEALERGALGSVIRVRNNQSRKVLETRVLSADAVSVVGPQIASIN